MKTISLLKHMSQDVSKVFLLLEAFSLTEKRDQSLNKLRVNLGLNYYVTLQ